MQGLNYCSVQEFCSSIGRYDFDTILWHHLVQIEARFINLDKLEMYVSVILPDTTRGFKTCAYVLRIWVSFFSVGLIVFLLFSV